ncbi:hypothetical protein E0W68_04450 [Flavobacterium salilacus subsp. salilacus]|uniref:hypothetical protein n=1 Tax=Flavobacterium TaxID=237 RepID=UPI00107527B5|nr:MULTISPECIES: hypothetical protein [Flavobacterium]KAF2519600.1 hypothetical protein E0W68_04450 [Flavobacterium salilacus subsp. salilacus]MBE1614498.1 hypothetical protein [Flavobacterium sp. SaA2.13]
MKKVLTLAAIALFTMTSCSSDDDSPVTNPDENVVLLKKRISTDDIEGTITTLFNYDGNKLTSMVYDDGLIIEFTYDGDKVVEERILYNGELDEKGIYTYSGDNLVLYERYSYDINDEVYEYVKKEYEHNSNGTIDISIYQAENETEPLTLQDSGLLTFENGNLISYTECNQPQSWTYDDKNSPFKNIASFNNIMILPDIFDSGDGGGQNNPLNWTVYHSSGTENFHTTYTYTYNSDGYPLTEIFAYDDSPIPTNSHQYFYE